MVMNANRKFHHERTFELQSSRYLPTNRYRPYATPESRPIMLPNIHFGSRSSVRPVGVMMPTMNSMPTTTATMQRMPLISSFSLRKIAARIVE